MARSHVIVAAVEESMLIQELCGLVSEPVDLNHSYLNRLLVDYQLIVLDLYAQARLAGSHVIVAAVEGSMLSQELRGLASEPVDLNLFNAERFSTLQSIVESVVEASCNGKGIDT